MANTSVLLRPYGRNVVPPGKSGDTFADLATAKNALPGSEYIGTDSVIYRFVKALNATAPADGDLCAIDKDASSDPGGAVDDAAAGDVGEVGIGVYVSAPAQNAYCFVAIRGEIQTKVNGASNAIAIGDILALTAANDLGHKVIATPYAALAGYEAVAWARAASTADESGLKKVYLLGIGW